eukprot:Filipodium_phascolosomae@DN1024_c0_g1_i1.p1
MSRLVVSSLDSTCTIFNVEEKSIEHSIRAHTGEVMDVCWGPVPCLFASVGSDSCARLFDTRCLKNSALVYRQQMQLRLVRIDWRANCLGILSDGSTGQQATIVVDIRRPHLPQSEIFSPIRSNAISWTPSDLPTSFFGGRCDGHLDRIDLVTTPESSDNNLRCQTVVTFEEEIRQLDWADDILLGVASEERVSFLHKDRIC